MSVHFKSALQKLTDQGSDLHILPNIIEEDNWKGIIKHFKFSFLEVAELKAHVRNPKVTTEGIPLVSAAAIPSEKEFKPRGMPTKESPLSRAAEKVPIKSMSSEEDKKINAILFARLMLSQKTEKKNSSGEIIESLGAMIYTKKANKKEAFGKSNSRSNILEERGFIYKNVYLDKRGKICSYISIYACSYTYM